MRISDWSSDVCSSDLSPIAYTPDMLPDALRLLIYFNPLAYYIVALQSLIVLATLPDWPIILGTLVFSAVSLLLGANVFKIGRASCRERGCQYVYISLVAVSLKKKTSNT